MAQGSQAVCCQLVNMEDQFQSQVALVGFVVCKVTVWQFFLQVLRFLPPSYHFIMCKLSKNETRSLKYVGFFWGGGNSREETTLKK
jgi:hypothetical protein